MRWKEGRRSSNVDDRRGGGRAPMGRGIKMGGGLAIVALLVSLLLGQDPTALLQQMTTENSQPTPAQAGGVQDEAADFTTVVLGYTEDVWTALFSAAGSRYQQPGLVLYDGAVESACGYNTAATGPFYCPGDFKMYLDLSFLRELQRLGAPGDFAFAYVIAHEIGHHVQNITGIERQVRQLQSRADRAEANALSVAMELQADCYAGIWAYHAQRQWNILEEGDIEEGLAAASAVGDDRLQRMAGQRVQPESFTHGSSAQRMEWFQKGFRSGNTDACDSFN
ncbi:MAG: neutral zinc metallopeptidase [Rhodothermales bacterium]|nr:neutral zinc metallopeptidase [Rhodothermales bacterium]